MGEVKFDIILMEFKLPQINGEDVARMIRDTQNVNTKTPIVAVTGYLKELQEPHHFDELIEKPPTTSRLAAVMGKLCNWKPPPPDRVPIPGSDYPLPSGLRKESLRSEGSVGSGSTGLANMPGSTFRDSSREDSLGSSFFGDSESVANEDVPVIISRSATDDWDQGLGISEEPADLKGLPHLIHQESAPPVLPSGASGRGPSRQRSAEQIETKRRSLEKRRHECEESGDDEDEELGDLQVRSKSPAGRTGGRSKLGYEMMRTNSRGSVVSSYTGVEVPVPSSGTEEITEKVAEMSLEQPAITPPEPSPKSPNDDVTPRQSSQIVIETSDEPTPRAPSALRE
jgi:serine/threonine-protein kinase RIM15